MCLDRPRLGERALGDLARSTETAARLEAPRRAGHEAVAALLPQDRGRRPGDDGGEADDLRGGVLLVHGGGERLAGQLEGRARQRGSVPTGRKGAEHERRLGRAQLRGESLLGAERLSGPEQLERDRDAVRAHGNEEEAGGADAVGEPPRRGRRQGEVVERRVAGAPQPAAGFPRARPRGSAAPRPPPPRASPRSRPGRE